jgi:hypothetical protein
MPWSVYGSTAKTRKQMTTEEKKEYYVTATLDIITDDGVFVTAENEAEAKELAIKKLERKHRGFSGEDVTDIYDIKIEESKRLSISVDIKDE